MTDFFAFIILALFVGAIGFVFVAVSAILVILCLSPLTALIGWLSERNK